MSRLVVDLNGAELYDVEPAVGRLETTGTAEVELRNHGQPVHVHLRPDDELAALAGVEGSNHYVEDGTALVVELPLDGAPVGSGGDLEIVTGYGKGAATAEIRVVDPEADDVDVDEDLGHRPSEVSRDEDGEQPGVRERLAARLPGAGPATPSLAERVGIPPGIAETIWRVATSPATAAVVLLALLGLALAGLAATTAPGVTVVAGIFVLLVGLGVAGYIMAR